MAIGYPTTIEGALKPSSIAVDGYEYDVFAHRHIQIETNQQGRWEYNTDGNILYAGYAPRGLSESSVDKNSNPTGWLLQFFTYSGNNVTSRTIAYGNWTNHAVAVYS